MKLAKHSRVLLLVLALANAAACSKSKEPNPVRGPAPVDQPAPVVEQPGKEQTAEEIVSKLILLPKSVMKLSAPNGTYINQSTISPDSKWLAVVYQNLYNEKNDSHLVVYSMSNGQEVYRHTSKYDENISGSGGSNSEYGYIAFSPSGKKLVFHSAVYKDYRRVVSSHILSVETKQIVDVSKVAIDIWDTQRSMSDDEKILWTNVSDKNVVQVNTETGEYKTLEGFTNVYGKNGLIIASAGSRSNNDQQAKFIDAKTGNVLLDVNAKGIFSIETSPNGLYVATTRYDNQKATAIDEITRIADKKIVYSGERSIPSTYFLSEFWTPGSDYFYVHRNLDDRKSAETIFIEAKTGKIAFTFPYVLIATYVGTMVSNDYVSMKAEGYRIYKGQTNYGYAIYEESHTNEGYENIRFLVDLKNKDARKYASQKDEYIIAIHPGKQIAASYLRDETLKKEFVRIMKVEDGSEIMRSERPLNSSSVEFDKQGDNLIFYDRNTDDGSGSSQSYNVATKALGQISKLFDRPVSDVQSQNFETSQISISLDMQLVLKAQATGETLMSIPTSFKPYTVNKENADKAPVVNSSANGKNVLIRNRSQLEVFSLYL